MSTPRFIATLVALLLLWGLAGGITACGGTGDDEEPASFPSKGPHSGPTERPERPAL